MESKELKSHSDAWMGMDGHGWIDLGLIMCCLSLNLKLFLRLFLCYCNVRYHMTAGSGKFNIKTENIMEVITHVGLLREYITALLQTISLLLVYELYLHSFPL